MNYILSAPLAAAGFAIVASALSMSADMMNMASLSLRQIADGHPQRIEAVLESYETPAARVSRFLSEIAVPLETLEFEFIE